MCILIYLYTDLYYMRITLVNWSRLGQNRYGTNEYPQSFLHSEGALCINLYIIWFKSILMTDQFIWLE